jgi:hypothetical protein
MSSGSKKKEPKCACLIEAKASHWQAMWAEFSSSTPHFLHSGLYVNLNKWRCLRRVLCPVRSRVTTLDCNLFKDRNLTLVPRQGHDINSRACRWELPRFCHRLRCWFPSQRPILFLRSCLETPKASSGPTNPEAEQLLASPSADFYNILCSIFTLYYREFQGNILTDITINSIFIIRFC